MYKYISLLLLFFFSSALMANEKPNILLILVDDAGYNDFGFQGSLKIKTPHIDSIAANGTRFTEAYVTASVCSPSRAGLITGRYQQRFGHEANCPPHNKGMDISEKTIADALKAQGYRTGLFGKWHLGDQDQYHPCNRGFDKFVGLREGSRSYFPNKKDDKEGSTKAIERNFKQIPWKGYFTDFLGDECISFIKSDSKKPFFALASFTAPHGPMHAKKEDLEKFKNSKRAKLEAMLYCLDQNVGRIIKTLKEEGVYDNTLIFFLSDNGGTPVSQSCNYPLNGYKGNTFEGGLRIPFLIQWPVAFKGGKTFDGMTSSLDIFATCLKVAGGVMPKEKALDGVDLMPFLTGKKEGVPHERLFWLKEDMAGMREGDWKLVRVKPYGSALYNLKSDLGEKNNLIKTHPEIAQRLEKKLATWEKNMAPAQWGEGKYWQKRTLQIHTEYIENRSTTMDKYQRAAGYDKDGKKI